MRPLMILPLAFVVACEDAPMPPAEAPPVTPAVVPAAAPVDARDQYELARDIDTALHARIEEAGPVLARTVRAWADKRVSWELRHVPALCRSAESCFLAPFDHQRFDKRMGQGWLPKLELGEQEHAELATRCEGIARCVVRVDAHLKTLVISPDDPTAVTLDRVAVREARAEREGESWVVSHRTSFKSKS
jgi:hypothetical protein